MERKKTTMYIDPELLRAVKVAAAREDRAEYLVVEDAIRAHLGWDLVEAIRRRANLDEDQAMALADAEVHAVRRARRKRGPKRA